MSDVLLVWDLPQNEEETDFQETMLRYIKELIHPISKKYSSSKEQVQTLAVSFKKTEKSLICQGDIERRSVGRDHSTEGKSHIRRCNDKLNEATSVLVEKMLSPYRDLVPGITNPDHLKNLTDLRTGEWFEKLQNFNVNDPQPHPRCEEVPRQFVFGESVSNNVTKPSSLKNVPKPTNKKLVKHKENELEMRRMLCNLKNQRELRKAKTNLESSPYKTMDQILSEPTAVSKQREKLQIEMNKILNDILNSGELAIQGSEQNKAQESKTGLINMDNILEYEKKMRGAKTTEFEETMKRLKGNPKEHLTSYQQEKNYINSLIEINRVLEMKMMKSKEKRTETIEKNRNSKEPRSSPIVRSNLNPIEIKNIQVLKLKTNNKEHTIGLTGFEDVGNVNKEK